MKCSYLAACALLLALPALAQTQSAQSQSSQPQSSQPQSSQSQSSQSSQPQSASGGATASRGSVPVQQGQTRQQKFDQLDTNHNGMISRAEAEASPELVLIFVDTDTNSDGSISAVEFQVVPLAQPDGTQVK
jgi:hypothetical protein